MTATAPVTATVEEVRPGTEDWRCIAGSFHRSTKRRLGKGWRVFRVPQCGCGECGAAELEAFRRAREFIAADMGWKVMCQYDAETDDEGEPQVLHAAHWVFAPEQAQEAELLARRFGDPLGDARWHARQPGLH